MNGPAPDWLRELPDTVAALAARWGLELGPAFEPGATGSWVAPARTRDGRDLVLKVGWRHFEAEHEADGLRLWAGRGAVVVHDAVSWGRTSALLLERCRPGDNLARLPEPARDEVVAVLLQRLWIEPPAGHPLRPLAEMCAAWADGYEAAQSGGSGGAGAAGGAGDAGVALDPGLVRVGLELFRTLATTAEQQVMLATDLHPANVLAAGREPWLMIDPKPWIGDPGYDPLQHMLNHPERLRSAPHAFADRMAGLCGLDPGRLRLWLFARCVIESSRCPRFGPVAAALAP